MAQRLELMWIGKDKSEKLEPRILIENPSLSHSNNTSLFNNGSENNYLIHGDNLLALKALEKDFQGSINCIYIDPPYNTGSAFEHYDDNLEHSIWLSLMRERLIILCKLLADDGMIFVQIDDNEQAYLTVLMDDIFGRDKRINTICVKMSEASGVKMAHTDKRLPKLKEYILVYCKNNVPEIDVEKVRLTEWNPEYKHVLVNISNQDLDFIKQCISKESVSDDEVNKCNDILKEAKIVSISEYGKANKIQIDNEWKFKNAYRIIQAVGSSSVFALLKRTERLNQDIMAAKSASGLLYLMKTDVDLESKQPRVQVIFADSNLEQNPGDLWTDIKTTGGVGQEGKVLFANSKKPEKLIKRIITMCTKPGDIVLDSFLGSGTTCAVAHKLNRRWIGIELGDHAYTLCKKRLDLVIDGNDSTGVTNEVGWTGGGSYKFYELAPTLINEDAFGEPIISKDYKPDMLAAAVALHEGFKYNPDDKVFWKQSKSNENAYLFVTTATVTVPMVKEIESQMADDEFLVIACKSFEKVADSVSNKIKIKKIPQMLLGKCEFGKDNYDLNIVHPPVYEDEEEE